jgi:cephalosporin-C deacetylase-like acetyl esterase
LICKITTDDYLPIDSISFPLNWNAEKLHEETISFVPPHPGFYRIVVYGEKNGVKSDFLKFNIGYNVNELTYNTDSNTDFDIFWEQTLEELKSIAPNFKMTLIATSDSNEMKNIYHVEMFSLGNVKIEGYYAVPKKAGKYPVVISFLGYGSGCALPNPNNLPEFCEFILSTRGQGIQKAKNPYGEWIVSGIESKENYYYRGAYMDLVRGVDFLHSRPEVDSTMIFAEGGSQGGAFTLALCALDDRIKAGAPYIPFLSDFPNYFKIAPWPREVFEFSMLENKGLDWEHVYNLLSYFDIKNLASKITCPIIMGVGLQDNVCPPRTNFAGYAQINSPKKNYIYSNEGHSIGRSWWKIKNDFFKSFL